MELHVGAAVREADDGVRAAEDLRDGLGVHVDLAEAEHGLELFLDGQVEERVERVLARSSAISAMCRPRRPRFFASFGSSTTMRSQRLENVESGPSGASTSARSFSRISGFAIGGQLVVVGALEDRQPRRHAAEHLAVLHREPVDDAAGVAERDRTDALARGLLDVRQMRLPAPRLPRLLEQGVVHDRPAARLRDPAQQLVLQLGLVPPPHWMTPVPTSRRTSASANSSSTPARRRRECGSPRCRSDSCCG